MVARLGRLAIVVMATLASACSWLRSATVDGETVAHSPPPRITFSSVRYDGKDLFGTLTVTFVEPTSIDRRLYLRSGACICDCQTHRVLSSVVVDYFDQAKGKGDLVDLAPGAPFSEEMRYLMFLDQLGPPSICYEVHYSRPHTPSTPFGPEVEIFGEARIDQGSNR